jgi:CARDB/Beta-propeller repeat
VKTSRVVTNIMVLLLLGLAFTGACSSRTGGPSLAHETQPAAAQLSAPGVEEPGARDRAQALFGNLPLYFIENRGQEDHRVAYYVQGRDTAVYFTGTGVTFALAEPRSHAQASGERSSHLGVRRASLAPDQSARARWAIQLDFVGANAVTPRGEAPTAAVVSYFKSGEDSSQTGLKTYGSIVYPELWPGIDLVYAGTAGHLKYTFLVKPGADPEQIRLAYRGASGMTLTDAGQLVISTPVANLTDDRPYSYQDGPSGRDEVPAAYAVGAVTADGTQAYGFKVGRYDRTRPLVLDPSLFVYAGFIGGPGRDEANGIAVDAAGNAYVVGSTDSVVPGFPAQVGPDLIFNGGSSDAFVAKVKADGTGLVYLGYIGGAKSDFATGIAVDKAGNAYVTGATSSDESTFPVKVGPALVHGGALDAFVAKVKADGTALVYCGYIGGAGEDDGFAIAVDAAGNAYVTGDTGSDPTSFPVKTGPDLNFNGGNADAFVAKVKADGTTLLYAGYIGGAGFDAGVGIAVDAGGNAYVTGPTASDAASFPVKIGPDLIFGGDVDAFVAKVKADGTGLAYAGYIGGSGEEAGRAIAVDASGNAYVAGSTSSDESSFPRKVGPDVFHNGQTDAFVAKVKADGTTLVYAGYIGGARTDFATGIAIDAAGNAYVAGLTESDQSSFPVKLGPDVTFNGAQDAFVAKVKADGTGLLYAGYVGGAGFDEARGIAVDAAGNVSLTGVTDSDQTSFPTTVGPDLFFNGGASDAFVTKLSGKPDLIQAGGVSFFPSLVKPGGTVNVFDSVNNRALGTAKASATRYYLSTDTVKSANDILLQGARAIPSLLPGDFHPGAKTVTVPAATPAGSYRILVCADDSKVVAETDEGNNCLAGGIVQVALPDLVAALDPLPTSAKAGSKFTISDKAINVGSVGAGPSITRYYLSKDSVKNAGDIMLLGSRTVPAINPATSVAGSVLVTIPPSTAAGVYVVLACADDANAVKETIETNNCANSPVFFVTK